ncbi:MAG: IS1595 family transposase [Roseiarcus sp.]
MSKSVLDAKALHDESAAYAWVETRLWPNGPICPHCDGGERISKMQGKSTRIGVYKCYHCRKQFTVKVGTVFEDSHVPMHLWLQAVYLMCSSKKGVSSNQLHRTLGVTLKTAWFMSHRLREAMRIVGAAPVGGEGQIVEADETFIGRKEGTEVRRGYFHKNAVLTLVERGGSARSFHIDAATGRNIAPIIAAQTAKESRLMTDEAAYYVTVGKQFASHHSVKHALEEFGYTDRETGVNVNTNTVEGFYSIFKRGMKGIYQHCKEKHLHRYLAEFDFRYSNRVRLGVDDVERTVRAVKGAMGKRLTYQTTDLRKPEAQA